MEKLLQNHKVFVIGGNDAIERIFQQKGAVSVPSIEQATIVVWTGGSDVSPDLYKEPKHPTTNNNPQRDKWEAACFNRAKAEKKLLVGICRGGQFLNVMNGGTLWQDVNNHAIAGEHPVTYDHEMSPNKTLTRIVKVTSTHHQMMIPSIHQAGGRVWAWAGLSTRKWSGNKLANDKYVCIEPKPGHQTDCEIVYYPRTRSLCFQPHPEYNSNSTRELFFTCIERALAA